MMTTKKLSSIPVSVLDLATILQGDISAGPAFQRSLAFAQYAEKSGYLRYWFAEHHNMESVASAATAVLVGFVAGGTTTIRVGSGGVMLPNHAPLVIAEQFGTLASLYPGRIDLGLGRAPGTDPVTSHALRRNLQADINGFPNDVVELLNYLGPRQTDAKIKAIPGQDTNVPVWLLGSSTYSAQLGSNAGITIRVRVTLCTGAIRGSVGYTANNSNLLNISKSLTQWHVSMSSLQIQRKKQTASQLLSTNWRLACSAMIAGRCRHLLNQWMISGQKERNRV
jgi:luciferase family oxidoreductase group 1